MCHDARTWIWYRDKLNRPLHDRGSAMGLILVLLLLLLLFGGGAFVLTENLLLVVVVVLIVLAVGGFGTRSRWR